MKEIIWFLNNHMVLGTIWVSLIVAVLFTTLKHCVSKVKPITRAEVIHLFNKEKAVIIDLRQYNSFQKGHIVGSINLVSTDIQSNNLKILNRYKNKKIILVDTTDFHAQNSANLLIKAGFKKVFVLKEGISGWDEANLPLVQDKNKH